MVFRGAVGEDPKGPPTVLQDRTSPSRHFFAHGYRSGNLIVGSVPVLVVDAIVEDRRFRKGYVRDLGERFELPPPDVERLQAEQDRLFDTQVDFLLFTHEGMPRPNDLTHVDSPWRITLRNDDGQFLATSEIRRIQEKDPVFILINKYFSGLNRETRMYRVSFPKLAKAVLGLAIGKDPFELVIAGKEGVLTLQWKDTTMFYRKAQMDQKAQLDRKARSEG